MEIKKQYFQKYLHDIAIEQIADDYTHRGYKISKDEKIGDYHADIIARKENEVVVLEVKTGKMNPQKKEAISKIGNLIRNKPNYKFLVVIAAPPKNKKLEIEQIEELLTNNIMNDIPDELDELSSHTRIEEVSDIDIDEIWVKEKLIFVKGQGSVSVELQYGSDGDQKDGGRTLYNNFPFDFEVILEYNDKGKLEIVEISNLEIDTSSFYE